MRLDSFTVSAEAHDQGYGGSCSRLYLQLVPPAWTGLESSKRLNSPLVAHGYSFEAFSWASSLSDASAMSSETVSHFADTSGTSPHINVADDGSGAPVGSKPVATPGASLADEG